MAPALAILLLAQPDAWAGQLGDRDAAVRDEATRRLRELGDAAIPALEAAAASADPERAERARHLLRELDDTRRLRELVAVAGPFTLDMRDPEPVAAILERVAAQAGRPILYAGPSDALWSGSIRDASLLATLDRVCGEAGLAYAPAPDGVRVAPGRAVAHRRIYAGPFAIDLIEVNRSPTEVTIRLAVGHERLGRAIGSRVDLVEPEVVVPVGTPRFERFFGGEEPFLRVLGIPADCGEIEALRGVLRISAPTEFEQWRFPDGSPGVQAIGDRGNAARTGLWTDDEALGGRRLWTVEVTLTAPGEIRRECYYEMEFELRGRDGTVLRDSSGPSYYNPVQPEEWWLTGTARFLVPAGSRRDLWLLIVRSSWKVVTADVPFEIRGIPLP